MTVAPIPSPPNLFLLPSVPAVGSSATVTAGLRPEQLVRALVVAAEAREEPLLEIGKERFRVISNRPLPPGRILDLRIVATEPRIEAVVLNNKLQQQLAQRLPALSRPLDWSGLLERLQQPETARHLQPAERTLVQQLQQLINPAQGRPVMLQANVDALGSQLRLLIAAGEPSGGAPGLMSAPMLPAGDAPALVASAEQSRLVAQLLGRLQAQLVPLVELGGEKMAKDWQRATGEIVTRLSQNIDIRSMPALRAPEWIQALKLLRQHPGVTAQISREAGRILAKLEATPFVTGAPQTAPLPSLPLLTAPPAAPAVSPDSGTGAVAPALAPARQQQVSQALLPLIQELRGLLGMGADAPKSAASVPLPLSPDVLGRIEGLTSQLHQLLSRDGVAPLLQQGLQLVAVQLQQLVMTPPTPARGEALGFVSQFFGLHLERELLLGKQKQALTNLKRTLLNLQQKTGEDFREPLNRIEAFQLCKARFAETQLQFLPLPLVGLSDGYLLAERRKADEHTDAKQKESDQVQLSLSVRLSSLGNMRVDLHFDPDQGLVVRLACEDQRRMEYMKNCEGELVDALTSVQLQQVHYSADARHPLGQLQQSLLPGQNTLLDTRA
ncbi:MAG: hypothetical protein R6V33_07585 [Pelovirga sp.]